MATVEVKEKEKVHVWLPWDYDYAKHILSWALSNFPKDETQIVATFIISTNYPDDKLNRWREICNKTLDKHLAQCAIHKFKAEKLIHEKGDSLVKGILELIDLRVIKNLVMDVSPHSELVKEKANPSCMIWFIQNGNLFYTRYPRLDLTEATSEEQIRREKLHQKIEEIQKRENDKNDLLKRAAIQREKLHQKEIEKIQKRENDKNDLKRAAIQREKLHQKEIEEIQKRENDKNDLLKRKNERLKLKNQLLKNQLKELSSVGSSTFNEEHVPSHFICPITQEIMKNPCIAADGFTYEAEAIKKWLSRGHSKSPMTNLVLPHHDLIQNHVLRSAIQEWLDQHPSLERNRLTFQGVQDLEEAGSLETIYGNNRWPNVWNRLAVRQERLTEKA